MSVCYFICIIFAVFLVFETLDVLALPVIDRVPLRSDGKPTGNLILITALNSSRNTDENKNINRIGTRTYQSGSSSTYLSCVNGCLRQIISNSSRYDGDDDDDDDDDDKTVWQLGIQNAQNLRSDYVSNRNVKPNNRIQNSNPGNDDVQRKNVKMRNKRNQNSNPGNDDVQRKKIKMRNKRNQESVHRTMSFQSPSSHTDKNWYCNMVCVTQMVDNYKNHLFGRR